MNHEAGVCGECGGITVEFVTSQREQYETVSFLRPTFPGDPSRHDPDFSDSDGEDPDLGEPYGDPANSGDPDTYEELGMTMPIIPRRRDLAPIFLGHGWDDIDYELSLQRPMIAGRMTLNVFSVGRPVTTADGSQPVFTLDGVDAAQVPTIHIYQLLGIRDERKKQSLEHTPEEVDPIHQTPGPSVWPDTRWPDYVYTPAVWPDYVCAKCGYNKRINQLGLGHCRRCGHRQWLDPADGHYPCEMECCRNTSMLDE
jgi:hypothetical protein